MCAYTERRAGLLLVILGAVLLLASDGAASPTGSRRKPPRPSGDWPLVLTDNMIYAETNHGGVQAYLYLQYTRGFSYVELWATGEGISIGSWYGAWRPCLPQGVTFKSAASAQLQAVRLNCRRADLDGGPPCGEYPGAPTMTVNLTATCSDPPTTAPGGTGRRNQQCAAGTASVQLSLSGPDPFGFQPATLDAASWTAKLAFNTLQLKECSADEP